MELFEIVELISGEFWERLEKLQVNTRYQTITPISGKATVLIGMRRVGKTFTLLGHIKSLIAAGIPKNSILYLNLEDDRLAIDNAKQLSSIIENFYSKTPANHKRQTYIFLDEIQTINEWEKIARRLVETNRAELWITGSSAKMLSKDVATQFRGRSLIYEIWPYDFFEYLSASKIDFIDPSTSFANKDLSREQLEKYLFQGGFPEITHLPNQLHHRVFEDYRNTVVLRDIIERHKVKNIVALEQLVNTAIANSGRLLSVNKLTDDFKSRGIAVSKDTIFEYLTHLEDAFLTFPVPLYSESLRVRSTVPKKIFCVDTGMIANYSIRPKADLGRLFENLIFIELRRRGYRVHYYVTKSGHEVDFVAISHTGEPQIIQVCYDLTDEKTKLREEQSLELAKKELACPGKLVTPNLFTQNRDWFKV